MGGVRKNEKDRLRERDPFKFFWLVLISSCQFIGRGVGEERQRGGGIDKKGEGDMKGR